MKKRISLVLAIIMVAAIMVSAIPFAAFAEDAAPAANVCRLGAIECPGLDVALMYASMAMEDVTITLLTDVSIGSITIANTFVNEATGKPVKVTLDGNGHTISGNVGNLFKLGGGSASPSATNNVVLKDFYLDYAGPGSAIQVYSGGDFLFEDIFMNCTAPITWCVINSNMENNTEGNPAFITMNNVDIVQPAYGGNNHTGDTSFVRTGNANSTYVGPVINYVFNDCDWTVTEAAWSVDHHLAAKGFHVTHANGKAVFNNCTITSALHPVYITSGLAKIEGLEKGKHVILNNTKLATVAEVGTKILNGYKDSKAEVLEAAEKETGLIYTGDFATVNGEYVAPADEALFIAEGEAAVDCTLADAIKKAKESTKNCTIKLAKDLTLTAGFRLETANKDVVLTFDGNDKTLTLSAGNAIMVGADGVEAKINLKNFDVNYSTGAGSIIQVYANGEVNLTDVKINNTAALNWCAVNALNKAGTTLTMTIDDCVFVSVEQGAKADVGVVRTGNGGNTVNLTIKNTDISVVGEGGDKPGAPLNITSELATVVIDDCAFTATANNAILVSKDITAKVAVTNSVLKVNEGVEITNKADLVDLAVGCVVVIGDVSTEVVETTEPVVDTTPEDTTPADEPEVTTPEVTDPADDVTTPEATDAPAGNQGGGCGGIAIAAQLVALICAAAALLVIKKK